ncbi:MAG: hypothetical protein WCG45_00335 [bacterium]
MSLSLKAEQVIDVFGKKENLTILLKSNDKRIKSGSVINYSESFYKVNQIVQGRFERVGLEVTKLDEYNGNESS